MLKRGGMLRRRVYGTLVTSTLLAGGYLAGPAAAPADASIGYYQHRNAVTGLCLDDSTSSRGNDVLRTIPCNNSNYQLWTTGANNNILKNKATGRCLDYSFRYGLRGFPCGSIANPSIYQAWYAYVEYSSIPAHIHFQGGEGYGCIDDSDEFHLRDIGCNGSEWQAWIGYT